MVLNSDSRMETKNKSWTCLSRLVGWSLVASLSALPMSGAEPVSSPDFREVYELLRTNLPGIDEAALQKASVRGLLSQFADRVNLISGTNAPAPARQDSVEARLMEERFAYLKLPLLDGVADEVAQQLRALVSSNQVNGGILDLRFTKGRDFGSAVAVASQLVVGTQPLLDWGGGLVQSSGTSTVARIPWTILVNAETSGSPEALAAALRFTETGILVGSKTAGNAATFRDFALRNGQRLSIANQPVKTPDGKEIPSGGLIPDIAVSVDLEQERLYQQDPSRTLGKPDAVSASGKNTSASARAARRRVNEADLVRLQKEGKRLDSDTISTGNQLDPVEETPRVQDPVLNRALDLLKGLAIVRKARRG
jgi:hypothetical protein